MPQKTVCGKIVDVNEEGYFITPSQWSEEMAVDLAKEVEVLEITLRHMEVLKYLREQHSKGIQLSLRKIGKSGILDIKEFYRLFPGGPLKKATFIAGIPKPSSCV